MSNPNLSKNATKPTAMYGASIIFMGISNICLLPLSYNIMEVLICGFSLWGSNICAPGEIVTLGFILLLCIAASIIMLVVGAKAMALEITPTMLNAFSAIIFVVFSLLALLNLSLLSTIAFWNVLMDSIYSVLSLLYLTIWRKGYEKRYRRHHNIRTSRQGVKPKSKGRKKEYTDDLL